MPVATASVAVVVVNWNDTVRSLRCLRSVATAAPEARLVLVDNGSEPDPAPVLGREIPQADIVRLDRNRGYAAGCNAGAARAFAAGTRHVLFLNNDAVIRASTLPGLLDEAQRYPAAILGPMIVYSADPGCVWSAGGYVVRPWMKSFHIGQGESVERHRMSRRTDWTTGCAMFVSAETYARVGPLDEAFFLYLEDVDWCLRAAARGIETRFVGTAIVDHEVSMTVRHLPPAEVRYYAYRNYYRLALRHCPWWARPLVVGDIAWTLARIASRSLLFPSYRRDAHYHARTHAILDVFRGRWGPARRTPIAGVDRPPVQISVSEASPPQ